MMIAILVVMLLINWKLALITFVILPFVIFFMLKFKVDIRKVYRLVRIRLAKINTSLSENISGIQTIQLFHQEKKKLNEFESVTQEYFEAEKKQTIWTLSLSLLFLEEDQFPQGVFYKKTCSSRNQPRDHEI